MTHPQCPNDDEDINIIAHSRSRSLRNAVSWLLCTACGAVFGGVTGLLGGFHYGRSQLPLDPIAGDGFVVVMESVGGGIVGVVIGLIAAIGLCITIQVRQKHAEATLPQPEAIEFKTHTSRRVRVSILVIAVLIASAYYFEWKADFYYPPTPLVTAAERGNIREVASLIADGANVNQQDSWGETALMKASTLGHWKCVGLLLDRGANVNVKDGDGETALDWVARQNNRGCQECLDLLICHGADVNARGRQMNTPLMQASGTGPLSGVKSLVLAGAHLNDKDDTGYTALMLASGSGRLDTVQYLLSKGAAVNAAESSGMTALIIALVNHKNDCAKILISKGADISAKDRNGETPRSLSQGNPEMSAILKAAGAK